MATKLVTLDRSGVIGGRIFADRWRRMAASVSESTWTPISSISGWPVRNSFIRSLSRAPPSYFYIHRQATTHRATPIFPEIHSPNPNLADCATRWRRSMTAAIRSWLSKRDDSFWFIHSRILWRVLAGSTTSTKYARLLSKLFASTSEERTSTARAAT